MACKYRSRSFVAVFLPILICVRVKILPCFKSIKKIPHFDDPGNYNQAANVFADGR